MYRFILKENEDAKITEADIQALESQWQIQFPPVLREYYLLHNGAGIRDCRFEMDAMEFCVVRFNYINYGYLTLEYLIAMTRKNKAIPNSFLPLAWDADEDMYYWNAEDDKVYYLSLGNVEHPFVIAESIDAFFDILNHC